MTSSNGHNIYIICLNSSRYLIVNKFERKIHFIVNMLWFLFSRWSKAEERGLYMIHLQRLLTPPRFVCLRFSIPFLSLGPVYTQHDPFLHELARYFVAISIAPSPCVCYLRRFVSSYVWTMRHIKTPPNKNKFDFDLFLNAFFLFPQVSFILIM